MNLRHYTKTTCILAQQLHPWYCSCLHQHTAQSSAAVYSMDIKQTHMHGKLVIAGHAPHHSPFAWQPYGRHIHETPAMFCIQCSIFTPISTKADISLDVTPCMLQPEMASQYRTDDILAKLNQTQHAYSVCICCICQAFVMNCSD
ncbi:TPA: hypothetical protein ACH3X2_013599 [Trebouxia sp. C0005]